MTLRQQRFVTEYARRRNGKAAALAAGYAASCAEALASRLLRIPAIALALVDAGVPLAFVNHGKSGKPALRRVAPFLNARQQAFVEHYLVLANASAAARCAGYAPRSARNQGRRLLALPQVAIAIDNAQAARAERMRVSADRVLAELARLGFADIRSLVDWGPDRVTVLPRAAGDPAAQAAIAEIVATTLRGGGTRMRIKLFDKLGALKTLMKHVPAMRNAAPADAPQRAQSRQALAPRQFHRRRREAPLVRGRRRMKSPQPQASRPGRSSFSD